MRHWQQRAVAATRRGFVERVRIGEESPESGGGIGPGEDALLTATIGYSTTHDLFAGSIAGAGFSIMLATDAAFASASARARAAYTALGLTPDGAMSWSLPRLIGWRQSFELLSTDRLLSADELFETRIVARVTSDESLTRETMSAAAGRAWGPTQALVAVRPLLDQASQVESLSTSNSRP